VAVINGQQHTCLAVRQGWQGTMYGMATFGPGQMIRSNSAVQRATQLYYRQRSTALLRAPSWYGGSSPAEVADALHPEGVTAADLARLLALALEALAKQNSPDEVADAVSEQVPVFAALPAFLRKPETHLALLQLIIQTVLAILMLLKPMAVPLAPPAPTVVQVVPDKAEIERMVEREIEQLERAHQIQP